MSDLPSALRSAIREVQDFPKPGIGFKDITPLLGNPELFRLAVDAMAKPFQSSGVTHVVAIESRGFLLGAPIAVALGAGIVPVRKPGKLPARVESVQYALEYGTDRLEMHADAIDGTARVLVVDDVLATGGTAAATGELVRRGGATIVGFSFLMTLSFLPGAERLGAEWVEQLLVY